MNKLLPILLLLSGCKSYQLNLDAYDFEQHTIREIGGDMQPEAGYYDEWGRWIYYGGEGHGTAKDTTAKGCGHPGC